MRSKHAFCWKYVSPVPDVDGNRIIILSFYLCIKCLLSFEDVCWSLRSIYVSILLWFNFRWSSCYCNLLHLHSVLGGPTGVKEQCLNTRDCTQQAENVVTGNRSQNQVLSKTKAARMSGYVICLCMKQNMTSSTEKLCFPERSLCFMLHSKSD